MVKLRFYDVGKEEMEVVEIYDQVMEILHRNELIPPETKDYALYNHLSGKWKSDIERWMNEIYRVVGYLYMINQSMVDSAYRSVLRALRLDYDIEEFVYDLVSEWGSVKRCGHPYSLYDFSTKDRFI